jgi:ketosteroid isomerase-like protein
MLNVSNEVAVSKTNPSLPDPGPEEDQPIDATVEGKEIEELFQRMPGNFRWPKPNAEAVAAAVEAIHRISGSAAAQDLAAAADTDDAGSGCSACGGSLPADARFCVWCGIPTHVVTGAGVNDGADRGPDPRTARIADQSGAQFNAVAAQHHFHHHYHHLVPGQSAPSRVPSAQAESTDSFAASTPRGRVPGAAGTSPGGRAEAGARQVVQDWAQACNTKRIDDLLELYAADATLIRSSVPPVRSLPAIREFLVSLLEAGLGDVEMESLRLEVMGEIALDLGRCKMLVPVAMGKRREERGKYLVVLARQPAGTWKIIADCWALDIAVNSSPEADARKGGEPATSVRKPR